MGTFKLAKRLENCKQSMNQIFIHAAYARQKERQENERGKKNGETRNDCCVHTGVRYL